MTNNETIATTASVLNAISVPEKVVFRSGGKEVDGKTPGQYGSMVTAVLLLEKDILEV